jgi:tRNA pseudouridine38-40 synthase
VLRLPSVPRLTVAGRTDAGVHARGQVVHLDVPAAAWSGTADRTGRVLARLASLLPPDVRARAVALAPEGFDARFSALWRRYAYRVCDDEAAADPLRRHETLWYFRRLDLAAMNEAGRACLGEHDFAAFCRRREGATTIRALRTLAWHRDEAGIAVATVVADAFCHNMVRALVGALLAVGEGRRPPGWPAALLAAAVRDPAVRVVPPHGLCLEEVGYPPPEQLAARAAETRTVRTAPGPGVLPLGRRVIPPEPNPLCPRIITTTSHDIAPPLRLFSMIAGSFGCYLPKTARDHETARGRARGSYCLPVSIRVLRLMLALPVTRFAANCSRACRCAWPEGDLRFAYSAHIRIR